MAGLSQVIAALRALASSALYPAGQFPSGPEGGSIAGVPVLVQSGWPDAKSLDKLVSDANLVVSPIVRAMVTVYPRQHERNVSRYRPEWIQSGALQPKTFTLSASGQIITVGGAQPTVFYGQNFAVFVNDKPYLYRTQSNDTSASVASALAALIVVDVAGTSVSGSAITIPAGNRIGALRVGSQAEVSQEVKRQAREFMLIVWTPKAAVRSAVADILDVTIGKFPRIDLPDGSKGRLIYKGTPYTDFDQKVGVYRQDFVVEVEYATFDTDTAPEAIAAKIIVSQEAPDGSVITPPIKTIYA